ncbi:MAG: TRAP transporter small permease [Oligoflexia bacterium]|nr:TRAP transporter small permease [Oligoflexia bacterium]
MLKPFKMLDDAIEKFSSVLLITCVVGMLFFSVANIVLRWFGIGFMWIEPLVRHLVFLSAFLGGVLATGRKTHIGIDIIGKYLESKQNWVAHQWVGRAIALISFVSLAWLAQSSIGFVKVEAQYGKAAFLGIHSKYLVSLIPFGFSLITYRFFFLLLKSFFEEPGAGMEEHMTNTNKEEA